MNRKYYEVENVRALSVSIESGYGSYPKLVVEYAVLPGGDELISSAGLDGIRRMAEVGFNWGFIPKRAKKDDESGRDEE